MRETEAATDLAQAEGRLPRWMLGLATVAVIAALASGHLRFALGLVLGSALAILNYYWLHQAVEHLMSAGHGRPPRLLIAKFILRYPLAFGGVYLLYRTGWVSLLGLFAGLFVPVGGVFVEAALQIRNGLRIS